MEVISLKLEKNLLTEIDSKIKKNRYATRTEFVRDAIRDKLSDLEKERLLRVVAKLHKSSKRNTTDEQLHEAGKRAFEILERKFRLK